MAPEDCGKTQPGEDSLGRARHRLRTPLPLSGESGRGPRHGPHFFDEVCLPHWSAGAAIRELHAAQQLNPNVGQRELASVYFHIGLQDSWRKHRVQAMAQDPNGETNRREFVAELYEFLLVDEARQMDQKLLNRSPKPRYYFQKKMFDQAAPVVESDYRNDPRDPGARTNRAILMISQGRRDAALAELNSIARDMESARRFSYYHHLTYRLAHAYAFLGRAPETYHWLQETVNEGFPCYPVFERDWMLDAVRNDPQITRLLAEVKERWEE